MKHRTAWRAVAIATILVLSYTGLALAWGFGNKAKNPPPNRIRVVGVALDTSVDNAIQGVEQFKKYKFNLDFPIGVDASVSGTILDTSKKVAVTMRNAAFIDSQTLGLLSAQGQTCVALLLDADRRIVFYSSALPNDSEQFEALAEALAQGYEIKIKKTITKAKDVQILKDGKKAQSFLENALAPYPLLGEALPDFSLPTIQGGTLATADLQGAPTLLLVFSTVNAFRGVDLSVIHSLQFSQVTLKDVHGEK